MNEQINITLTRYPTEWDWMDCKERALVTVGKGPKNEPSKEWKEKILEARHSPIRSLRFSFKMTIPYWVSVHLARHVHAQPYILSQRNDRQDKYDRNAARQDEMVQMIWDMNAEELITIAQKRLCSKAAVETRAVVQEMRNQVCAFCPEFEHVLVPACEFDGRCHEMASCGRVSARWFFDGYAFTADSSFPIYRCSNCEGSSMATTEFCPHCGKTMFEYKPDEDPNVDDGK